MLKLVFNPYRGSPLEKVKEEKNISLNIIKSIEKIDNKIEYLNGNYYNCKNYLFNNYRKIIVR